MNIKIHSKLSEEEFKDFLMFRQFKMNKSFVPVRVALSAAIGLLAAFIGTGNKVVSFAVIFAICLAVFIWFPKMNISSKYKKIYRRNLSGAFHQYQDFCFTDNAVGFKSESEEEYDWTMYDNLLTLVRLIRFLWLFTTKNSRRLLQSRERPKMISELFQNWFLKGSGRSSEEEKWKVILILQ